MTNGEVSGILTKLFDGDEVNESGAWRSEKIGKKNLKKIWKKYLTNETEPDIIVTVPLEGRAPCKLNNVKKKHEAPEKDLRSFLKSQDLERLLTNFFEAMESFNKMI